MSKKYTFEDWLEGRIDNNKTNELHIQFVLYQDKFDHMPYEEYKKISDYKREVFRKAVEITAASHIKLVRKKLDEGKVKNPENWLTLEINKVEQFISEYPDFEQIYEEYTIDELSLGFIDVEEAKRVNEMYGRFKENKVFIGVAGFSVKKNGEWIPHRLSDIYVKKRYLAELKILKDPENEIDPRLKYFPDKFWDSVGEIRESNGLTWEQTYDHIKNEMNELKIPFQYSSFDSFRKLIPNYLKGKKFPKKGNNMS